MAAPLQSVVFLSNRIDPHRRLFASPARSLPGTKGSILVVRSDGRISGRLSGRNLITNAVAGHFDDVERAPILPSKPPKETKEMDENKSKKGLAEIYEEEYAQKTGLALALLSTSDKLKIEATMLFKKISLKLDALSHFHFAPKPVIEDMSIQVNVPALAMEEVAPLAVSDAAMLAPEEIFHGKGNIKEEAELTKEERKRRRANQKRRFRRLKGASSAGHRFAEPLPVSLSGSRPTGARRKEDQHRCIVSPPL
ncbi:hypothetical protein ZIOFF_011571 [Zingiber officinale]|uniref:Uncharacterized protein n=1 Tax=Zingiber officinale TaxID=94328 RepID=A0A8J5HR69_ZINOF|nr:hypothetical protein ZIOFF_011571 [Zingiber officinale]